MAHKAPALSTTDSGNRTPDLGTAPAWFLKSTKHPNAIPAFTEDETNVAVYWNGCYATSGPIWGLDPSETAIKLISAIRTEIPSTAERLRIVELGCGYGRDTFALAKAGLDVLAVDTARQGLVLANEYYQRAVKSDVLGRVYFLHGTIRTLTASATGEQFDGLTSHRALHLMKKEEVISFARCAAELVRPGGFISIGARSRRDFDPEIMEWVEGQEGETAKYRDAARNGHFLRFLDEALLRTAFEPYFEVHFWEGREQERIGSPTLTKLVFMMGTRKS